MSTAAAQRARADSLARQNRLEEAAAAYGDALALAPGDAAGWLALALVSDGLGRLDAALAAAGEGRRPAAGSWPRLGHAGGPAAPPGAHG
ncbi:MAG: tetratricopeptide repeat protein [Azospirillaceae bacterium]|nr:tetratricopeptide repeat protein [Azospirillaceae bacterium]